MQTLVLRPTWRGHWILFCPERLLPAFNQIPLNSNQELMSSQNVSNSCNFTASLVTQRVKNLPAMQETGAGSLGWEDPLEKRMATHSSILAWRFPRTVGGRKESDTTEWISLSVFRLEGDKSSLFFFQFLFLLYFTLQYCIGFAIHWHESTMGVHAISKICLRRHQGLGRKELTGWG